MDEIIHTVSPIIDGNGFVVGFICVLVEDSDTLENIDCF